jgi:Na+-transporting methylmalonyl-CoA/oxaloacetate decarboxylase gamma subunit
MTTTCPKCRHVRSPDATNPAWECPACGICYAKFAGRPEAQSRPSRAPSGRTGQGGGLGWLAVLVLVAGLAWAVSAAMGRRHAAPADQEVTVQETGQQAAQQPEQQDTSAGARITNAVLQAADADVSMLKALSGRLEGACARNKYGLSEQACAARLRAREDLCATGTAQRFPGALADTGRMQVVTKAYVGCIFED